jgi:hypothetical protein
MKIHPRILGKRQRHVLAELGLALTPLGYYLGGGTGLALQLGHRHSIDLDWFTGKPMGDPFVLAHRLRDQGIPIVAELLNVGTLHAHVRRIRVSLLEYPYPRLHPTGLWQKGGCRLASLDDLAAMKLSAIAQRGAKKDFVDLYALCTKHARLPELLKMYQRRFDIADIGHLLYSITYFQDADQQRMPRMFWKVSWPTIKSKLRSWVADLAAE